MFIAKTVINKEAITSLGKQLFKTKRTHKNDLVALQYMVDEHANEYTAIRMRANYGHILKYTFCWAVSPDMYHNYVSAYLEIDLKQIVNNEHRSAYVCFFTGSIYQWVDYCKDTTRAPDLREEVKQCLSKDGYSLLFKENKKLE